MTGSAANVIAYVIPAYNKERLLPTTCGVPRAGNEEPDGSLGSPGFKLLDGRTPGQQHG
jgi:hypothetical protein